MSESYNPKLISKLYQESDEDKILEILEEMDEIGDPYFLRPIYDKYKEEENSYISHYFLSSIAKFKSEDAKDIAKEIALNPETTEINFIWILDYLAEIGVYDEIIVNRVKYLLSIFDEGGRGKEYDLDSILFYLDKAKALADQADVIKTIFENGKFSPKIRKKALDHFLRINPKQYFQYYFDNYDDIKKDETAENIFAHEIETWNNGIIPKFKQKIIKEGGSRAKEIIAKHLKVGKEEERKKEEKTEKEAVIKYANAPLVNEIYQLRENINSSTLNKWGFKLFPPSEILSKQTEVPQQRSMLIAYCNDLRSILKSIDSRCSYENFIEAKKIISGIEDEDDLKKPLNQLQLYLHSQGLVIDKDIFGLRNLNYILNLIDHPEAEENFLKSLQKIGLADLWSLQDWAKIHRRLLEIYKTALEKLHVVLIKSIKLPT